MGLGSCFLLVVVGVEQAGGVWVLLLLDGDWQVVEERGCVGSCCWVCAAMGCCCGELVYDRNAAGGSRTNTSGRWGYERACLRCLTLVVLALSLIDQEELVAG